MKDEYTFIHRLCNDRDEPADAWTMVFNGSDMYGILEQFKYFLKGCGFHSDAVDEHFEPQKEHADGRDLGEQDE